MNVCELIRDNLSDDILRPEMRMEKREKQISSRFYGHCLTAARVWYVLKGMPSNAQLIRYFFPDGRSHWFVRISTTGEIVDLTKEQLRFYPKIPKYSENNNNFKVVNWSADSRAHVYTINGKKIRLSQFEIKLIQKIAIHHKTFQ